MIVSSRWIAAAVLVLSLSTPTAARADVTPQDRATAEALYNDGRRLMSEGRYAEACPKFEESQRIDPGTGTLLNLGECNARLGKTASAWAIFLEASYSAKAAGEPKREATARAKAAALEPKLSRLTIVAGAGAADVEIKRDGKVVAPSVLGTAVPVDPGEHTVTATAPGRRPWTSTVTVNPDGHQAMVSVPQLEPEVRVAPPPVPVPAPTPPPPAPAPAPPPAPVVAPPPPPPPPPPDSGRSARRAAGIVVGIAGLGGLGVATAFTVLAKNDDNASNTGTPRCNGTQCPGSSYELREQAYRDGNIATAAVVLGGVAAATGLVLILTSVSSRAPAKTGGVSVTVGMGPSGAGIGLKGSFQ